MHNIISHNQLAGWKQSIDHLSTTLADVSDQSDALNETCFANRSVNSRNSVSVRFKNNFSGTLEAVWIDYQGNQVSYGKIRPNQVKYQQTYISHPWAFVDPTTGNCVGYYNPKIGDQGKQIQIVK